MYWLRIVVSMPVSHRLRLCVYPCISAFTTASELLLRLHVRWLSSPRLLRGMHGWQEAGCLALLGARANASR